jgi:hypothetical protein
VRLLLAAVITLPIAACTKDHPQCDRFVDLTMQCDAEIKAAPSGEQRTARAMMDGMCEEAFRNDTSSVSGETRKIVSEMYAELRDRADCTATASTCEQYARCTASN